MEKIDRRRDFWVIGKSGKGRRQGTGAEMEMEMEMELLLPGMALF